MALGDTTNIAGDLYAIEILASVTAANSPPASLTAGVAVDQIASAFGGIVPDDLTLLLVSTAGSATMSCSGRLWMKFGTLGSLTSIGAWAPAGVGTGAAKGLINAGASIDETGTDMLRHAEPVSLVAHAERIYLEITAIGGTSTAVRAFLVGRRRIGSY
jgi:hypothetical protein